MEYFELFFFFFLFFGEADEPTSEPNRRDPIFAKSK
jgi:hypothetical protein